MIGKRPLGHPSKPYFLSTYEAIAAEILSKQAEIVLKRAEKLGKQSTGW